MKPTYVDISISYRDHYGDLVLISASKLLRDRHDLEFIDGSTDPRDLLKEVLECLKESFDTLYVSTKDPAPMGVLLKIVEMIEAPVEKYEVGELWSTKNCSFIDSTIPLRVCDNGRWYDAEGEVSIHVREDGEIDR